jgi:hypothetical protein
MTSCQTSSILLTGSTPSTWTKNLTWRSGQSESSRLVPMAVYRAGHSLLQFSTWTFLLTSCCSPGMRVSTRFSMLEYEAPLRLNKLRNGKSDVTHGHSCKYSVPRICRMVCRWSNSTANVIENGSLTRYKSPATMVQPLVEYNCRLVRSEIGNASHSTPHVLHCETQAESNSNNGQNALDPHYRRTLKNEEEY